MSLADCDKAIMTNSSTLCGKRGERNEGWKGGREVRREGGKEYGEKGRV